MGLAGELEEVEEEGGMEGGCCDMGRLGFLE